VNAGHSRRARRYRPGRKRRAGTAALTGLAAGVAATLLLALGARSLVSHAACSAHPVIVNVAVSSEIEPAVRHLGQIFNGQHRMVSGRCAQVAVNAEPPAAVAAQLAGAPHGRHLPPVSAWIPDSDLWAGLARGSAAGARRVRATGIVVARSPLVIAMPRSAAAVTPAFGSSVSWKFLLPQSAGGPSDGLGLHVEFPDPASSATGLVALTELHRIVGQGAEGRADLAEFALHVQVEPPAGAGVPLASLAAWTPPADAVTGPVLAPVTVTTEQAVAQFDRAHPRQPLAVRYPAEGSQELSYPYLLTTASPATRAAADDFGTLLRSSYTASYLRDAGFRTGSGRGTAGPWPGWYGLTSGEPHLLAQPTAAAAAAILRTWQRLSLGSRDLALVDISSAMTARSRKGGPDLQQQVARAAGAGLAMFPDSTEMGLWTFPSRIVDGLAYQQLVPVGPLPARFGAGSRRQRIQSLVQSGQPLANVPAPLYRTILTGYQQMLATYRPRYTNALLVLTAGVDHDATDLTATTLIHDLQVLYDPKRPVRIVVVMLGPGGDLAALSQIAATTSGQATAITSYSQLGPVLYHALAQGLCQPSCPS
jgi:Bacterial extracellular solute-binding protein